MEIDKLLNLNNTFIDKINQILHNKGILFEKRLDYVMNIFNNQENLNNEIVDIFKSLTIHKNEIYQIMFMYFCNKSTKINLDQFYTPFTICNFINNLLNQKKKIIDPACGTGDLILNYDGDITLWDINKDVLTLTEQNFKYNNKIFNIECIDSIKEFNKNNSTYDYCCLNPPFGSSTTISDPLILKNYILGKTKKTQEIGILFIERSMNLLKNGGVLFLIIPNGYLGNSTKKMLELRKYLLQYCIIAIIELPHNTFARSGTGVSTSLLIIQKKKNNNNNIFITKIENIGYVLNKKNTPYKFKKTNGNYIISDSGLPILDNDLDMVLDKLLYFNFINNYNFLKMKNKLGNYEFLQQKNIKNNILDINRYLDMYLNIINNVHKNGFKKIKNYIINSDCSFVKSNEKEYIYLDIKQITSPLYKKTNLLYGYDLPLRAKYNVKLYDILVSRLKGTINFTIILDDFDNIIASNGFCILRCKTYEDALLVFSNLFSNDFKIQHNSLCTGSIMESLTDEDVKNIYINPNINLENYKNIINALHIMKNI
jgi:hypothetical protein